MAEDPKDWGEFVDDGLRTAARTIRRVAYVGFALFAFALVLVGKIDARLVDNVRALVGDVTAPAMDVFSYPLSAFHDALQNIQSYSALREENARLREENARLAQLRIAAHQLREENKSMRRLLRFEPGPTALSVATRVVADTGGVFARSVMVHIGRQHGLRSGLPVMGASGLVGRVQSVGERAARVLLITDLNSRIPVAIGDGRLRAIMTGRNVEKPALEFLTSAVPPVDGALVVTSGDGGMFHPGLPIGVVERSPDGALQVQPFVDWMRLDHVRIFDFGDAPKLDLAATGERE